MDTAGGVEVVRFAQLQCELSQCRNRFLLLKDPEFTRKVNNLLDEALGDRSTILSLDVFDTLLLRDTSSEVRRFYEIGMAMVEAVGSHPQGKISSGSHTSPLQINAFLARHLGTKATYRASDRVLWSREGSLSDIHKVAAGLLNLSDAVVDALINAEIDYEATRISCNEFLLNYLHKLKSDGRKIILVSDMYFEGEQLRHLLEKKGIKTDLIDRIYSSGDCKVTKSSGLMYKKINEDFSDASFFHIGDNLKGDFLRAREHGWKALHLPVSDAEIMARRACHDQTVEYLFERYKVRVDVQRP